MPHMVKATKPADRRAAQKAGKPASARPRHPGPGRGERGRDVLRREGWDALAVTSLPNVRWLSGYTGSSAVMLVGRDGSWFVTDFRYREQVRDEVRGSEVEIAAKGLPQSLVEIVRRGGYRKLGVEADFITLRAVAELRAGLPKRTEIVHARDVVGELRMVKDHAEIEAIRRAVDLAAEAYDSIVPLLRPGTSVKGLELPVEKLRAEGSPNLRTIQTRPRSNTTSTASRSTAGGADGPSRSRALLTTA